MRKMIALSGSHGVGKTTLFNAIVNDSEKEKLIAFNEINTGLFNIGFSLNCKSDDFDEVVFSQKSAFNLGFSLFEYYLNRNDDRLFLSDRSPLDTYIYTLYFCNQMGKVHEYADLLNEMKQKSLIISEYTLHILIPPFNAHESIFKERMDVKSQKEIHEMFLDFFNELQKPCNCIILSENEIVNRFTEFKKSINSF